MNICGTASTWAKVACVLLIVALGLHVAGFATVYWLQVESIQENVVFSHGLWKALNCSGGHDSACNDLDVPDSYKTGQYKAMQGMQSLVLVLIAITAIVFVFYVASERFREMSIAIFLMVMCFLTVTMGVIAMIVWVADIPENHYVGYSFGLAVFAFLLLFLAGIIMIPDIRRYNNRNKPEPLRVAPDMGGNDRGRGKYDQLGYDHSYNRKFVPTQGQNVRHYYNPNREPYTGRTPPPLYRTSDRTDKLERVERVERTSYRDFRDTKASLPRTEVRTPDVYLGRDTKITPRRY